MNPSKVNLTKMGLSEVIQLYHKYQRDLQKVRREQADLYVERGYVTEVAPPFSKKLAASSRRVLGWMKGYALLKPQLDDVEAEITYLLLRELRPRTIVEVSPCGGWSSTWILRAIRDNGVGHLFSFDLVDDSVKNIPLELAEGKRTFIQGKIQENLSKLPEEIEYLFVDSDHSSLFAEWYIEHLFSRLKSGTPVSIHDVFHTGDPSGFDSEGGVVVKWLEDRKISFFTPSPAKNPSAFNEINRTKLSLNVIEGIHRSKFNSMIYFRV